MTVTSGPRRRYRHLIVIPAATRRLDESKLMPLSTQLPTELSTNDFLSFFFFPHIIH
jgi:hypothetical protein